LEAQTAWSPEHVITGDMLLTERAAPFVLPNEAVDVISFRAREGFWCWLPEVCALSTE